MPAEHRVQPWPTLCTPAESRFGIGILPDNLLPQQQGVAQFETGYCRAFQRPCRNNICAPTLIDFAIGTSGRTSSWCRRRFYKPKGSFAVSIVAKVSNK